MEKPTAAYLIVAASGIGLAIYVAIDYLTHSFTSCNINQVFNCGGVYQSGQTSLFGIPFYVMGIAWFPAVFAIGLLTSRFGKRPVNTEILLPILMVGNIFTTYLWYLELAVIHIICPLCVGLYVVNYALTLIVLVLLFREPDVSNPDLEGEANAGVVGPRIESSASRGPSPLGRRDSFPVGTIEHLTFDDHN